MTSPGAQDSTQNAAQLSTAASSAATGTTSPLAAGSAPAAQNKNFSGPPIASSGAPPVAVGGQIPVNHGKTNSVSPVNGRGNIPPAVPAIASSTPNGASAPLDHSRKSSVTIPGGGPGYPNGGPVGQGNKLNINFGNMPQGSPALAHSTPNTQHMSLPGGNPRTTDPLRSPSPIPQAATASSGGRPPSSLASGNGIPFGQIDGGEIRTPSMGSAVPAGPNSQHLRRESSQSAPNDYNNNMNRFGQPAGRGRGFAPQPPYGPSHSPGPYNMPQPRTPQFPAARPMNSPFMPPRSPAMQAAMPGPHMAQPMPHGYGGYPQYPHAQPMYGMQPAQDPTYPYYATQYMQPGMQPGMPGMYPGPPQSPQPFQMRQQGGYMPPYAAQGHAPGMSRSSSHASEQRPPSNSNLPLPQTPSAPSTNHVSHTPSQSSSSPAAGASNFTIPPKTKSKAIQIKNADGQVVTFDKKAASPAPSQPPEQQRGPTIVSSTPTPPPRAPSATDSQSESTNASDAEKKKQEFQKQVREQLEAEARQKKEEEEKAAKEVQEKADAEAKAAKAKEEEEAANAAKAAKAAKEAEEAEQARAAAEKAAAEKAEEKAEPEETEDERLEREIREMEELEAKREKEEQEAERLYQEKKKKQAEEKAKLDAEAAAKADEEMRRAEREAEEREEAREKEKASSNADADLFAALKRPTFGPGANLPSESGTSTPTSEASAATPAPAVTPQQPRSASSTKPKPLPLKIATDKPVEPAQPTAGMQALKSARFLQVRNESIKYPDGFKSPNPALNQGSKSRGRQYDKDFLLQFQDVFKEKPSPEWDTKIRETIGDGSDSARPQSARTPAMGPRQSSRSGLGPGMMAGPMGQFGGPAGRLPPGTTSEQRFQASNQGRTSVPTQNPFAQFGRSGPGNFPMPMGQGLPRPGSFQNIPQGVGPNSPRPGGGSQRDRGSKRGQGRTPSHREEAQMAKAMPLTAGMDLKPLEMSGSGWKPSSIGQKQAGPALPGTHLAPDMVQRKVNSALNKMTPEKFDKLSDQILEIAAQSKDETDGRTLRQVIQLTFEKACDEAHWVNMYARFCHKMLTTMSTEIKDDNIRDKNGQPVVGGALFRKYLLNRCQEDFEHGWEDVDSQPEEEAVMLSDEYYVKQKEKRKRLGLTQFIGELYKFDMLTLRIMHECVHRLLNFEGLPDEQNMESLTKLLGTIGGKMDSTEQGRTALNQYFQRIADIGNRPELPSRVRFMLMDVIDLRKANWRTKQDKGPKTITQIHEEAQAAQAAAEADRLRQSSQRGGRPPPGRGDVRSFSGGGPMAPPDFPRNQLAMDDLRKLSRGASNRQSSNTGGMLGPSMFGSRSSSGRKGGLGPSALSRGGDDSGNSSRTNTPPVKDTAHANAFGALAGLDASGDGNEDNGPSPATSPPTTKSVPAGARSKSPAGDKADAEKSSR